MQNVYTKFIYAEKCQLQGVEFRTPHRLLSAGRILIDKTLAQALDIPRRQILRIIPN